AAILALTAHVIGAAAEAWRAAGMDGVVHKPFTLQDLSRALQTHCGQFMAPAPDRGAAGPGGGGGRDAPASADTLFAPAAPGDLARLASAGRPVYVARILARYADLAPHRLAALAGAWAAEAAGAVARAAHALKSMSLSLGA